MRVSVVLPTYERASAVGDAIESVLDQTASDLELVVLDGGSSDGTADVVDRVADSRVRYRRKPAPDGVSAARNEGIEAADGELIAFVDSDDRWREDKLERQLAAYEAGGACGVVYCGLEKPDGEPRTRDGESGDVRRAVRRMAVPTYTSTLLVERRALRAVGGFDESLPCFEDWDLCLRLAEDYAFRYVDAPLVVKGTGADNVSAQPRRLATAVRRLRRSHDLPDETVARLLADVGVTACETGALRRGRPYLWRSLRFDHAQADTAFALLCSYTNSPRVFDRLLAGLYAAERYVAGSDAM